VQYIDVNDDSVQDAIVVLNYSSEEFGRLHRRVKELSGATPEQLHHFFAEGMLLNIAAAVELAGDPTSWMLADLEGGT
ncbi:MAG TPA: hypothetical protein VK194_06175, partial [Candidatus Deferrimicrobium sp.]|nr:hypothetical protein [Candidatus Deferrimicrobium sp.]